MLDIGRQCVPFTTEYAEANLLDANNVPNNPLPPGGNNAVGLPVGCSAFASAGPAGLSVTSAVTFFEAPIARDSAFLFFLGCE